MKLPWKDTSCNNKTQALSRLNSLSKMLNTNPDIKTRYDAVLEELQKNGIIGKIQKQNEDSILIPNLVQTLLKFRRWSYGLTADIIKAILHIELNKCDQDSQRILRYVNDQIRTMRFDRVILGNTSRSFLLNATLKFHLPKL